MNPGITYRLGEARVAEFHSIAENHRRTHRSRSTMAGLGSGDASGAERKADEQPADQLQRPDRRASAGALLRLREQIVQVQIVEDRGEPTALTLRPLIHRPVPGELEGVAVRIGQVDGLVRAVVGELPERDAGSLQPPDRVGKARARWVIQRHMM